MDYRKRLYEIIEVADDSDKLSSVYDVFMMITIIVSIVPLAFKSSYPIFDIVDKVTVVIVNSGLRLFKVIRLLRTLRVLRVFKAIRYSNNVQMILGVFRRTKESLLIVCGIAGIYTLISALVIFNVEPDTFETFFDAVYWATVSLTTMGYGDIYPISVAGRIVTMISSFMGIAIVALPAGIITSGMMEEINNKKNGKGEKLNETS